MPAHFLDELAVAPASAVPNAVGSLSMMFADRVGPIVEYEFFRRHGGTHLPRLSDHTQSRIAHQIVNLLDGIKPPTPNHRLQAAAADAIAIPIALGRDTAWTAFVKRLEMTAREVGFGENVAAGLAGAVHELADNVIQHSEAPSSGLVAFARSASMFEYVVADAGIGMLASLRRAPEFASLRDDLEALPLAVTPGVSRHGRGIGYGYGYRAVFLPLKAAHGVIRLRSGRAVLELVGLGPRPDQGRCSQRPHHQGVVVSVEISTITGQSSPRA
jgi:anti-sigma regulatory factor (Ser/Thr protein kinase)